MERNHPLLYLYGDSSSAGNDEAAKVRIAYTREKHDHSFDKAEGEWICKVVSVLSSGFGRMLTPFSATSTISQHASDASDVKPFALVCFACQPLFPLADHRRCRFWLWTDG